MRLLPRDEAFFDLFLQVAQRAHEAAGHLTELLTGSEDRRTYAVQAIKRLENEADEITHDVVTRLDRTFITPIDREDIHLLASDLDDVIDHIDGAARRAQIFRLGPSPEGIDQLCGVVDAITKELVLAVQRLGGKDGVMAHCIEVKRLEEVGDALYHEMLGKLFDTERDPITLIKWKEMYDILETTIDASEDVANDIESIFLKHA